LKLSKFQPKRIRAKALLLFQYVIAQRFARFYVMDGTAFNFALQNYYFILDCAKKMKKINTNRAEMDSTVFCYVTIKEKQHDHLTI